MSNDLKARFAMSMYANKEDRATAINRAIDKAAEKRNWAADVKVTSGSLSRISRKSTSCLSCLSRLSAHREPPEGAQSYVVHHVGLLYVAAAAI